MMTSMPRRAWWAFASLSFGLAAAAACGGSVRGDNGGDVGSASSQGAGAERADSGSDAGSSTAPGSSASNGTRGCTPSPNGSGSSSSGGGGGSNPNSPGRDIDLCKGDVLCGVGLFCETPQQCCVPGVSAGNVDPATCPCGVVEAVIGTHCAASCSTTPQQCFQDPGGRNTDCPAGQACVNVSTTDVGNVPVVLATCGPAGSAESGGSSSSGGNDGTGSCVDPGEACPGSLVECSSALSCATGQICCETMATVCAACPVTSPCDLGGCGGPASGSVGAGSSGG
jgi:hypothetical protein